MRNYRTWYWLAIAIQFLTAAFHALSFLNDPVPKNESERILFDLMRNYRQDLGAASVSTEELMIALSSCFSLLYLFGGLINAFFLRNSTDRALLNGLLWINLFIFGICFVIMLVFTFLPPILATGLVFFFLIIARITRTLNRD